MDNNYLLSLPIKSLNNVVKERVSEINPDFQVQSRGVLYKNNYFDFRVTKIMHNYSLVVEENAIDEIININQIAEDPIILCIIFIDYFKLFILDNSFFLNHKSLLSNQHHSKNFQMHVTYKFIKSFAKRIV